MFQSMIFKRIAWVLWRTIKNKLFNYDFHLARVNASITGMRKYADQQIERSKMYQYAIAKLEARKAGVMVNALKANDTAQRLAASFLEPEPTHKASLGADTIDGGTIVASHIKADSINVR